MTTEELKTMIHPVRFPDLPTMQLWTPHQPKDDIQPEPGENDITALILVTKITPQVDHYRDLADTGASVCATSTGMKENNGI
jgi:hypothetical protein